ncbi:hypothetical protein COOONC_08482 [Cooperia oncophora]
MDNFAALFNAFETRVGSGNEHILQLQQSNAKKQETIASLKERIARYKQQESEQKAIRENAERSRKELLQKLSKSLISARTLQGEFEKLSEQFSVQTKIDQELRMKMCDLNVRLSRIAEADKQLRNDVQKLKEPVAVAPQAIAAVQEMEKNVEEKLKMRRDAFDLTALVAEVQTIEQQRQERLKMSEELREKFEYSSAQDVDNGEHLIVWSPLLISDGY